MIVGVLAGESGGFVAMASAPNGEEWMGSHRSLIRKSLHHQALRGGLRADVIGVDA